MNGLAKQRGSRFFVAERHHNHSDVTVGSFYEEKKNLQSGYGIYSI